MKKKCKKSFYFRRGDKNTYINHRNNFCSGGSSTADTNSLLENYAKENLNIHTRGLLRRKVPVLDMISWTKESIRKPLLTTVEKNLKSSAVDMFRLVQVNMY